MTIRAIRLLGDPRLYEPSAHVLEADRIHITGWVADLHDTLMDYRARHGAGRAIAAPQVGIMRRLIYVQIERSTVLVNPVIEAPSDEMMPVWDDCMCFPGLLVRVLRHRGCRLRYLDQFLKPQSWSLEGELSELLQHECDHLDGILAVSRAIDARSFALKGAPGPEAIGLTSP